MPTISERLAPTPRLLVAAQSAYYVTTGLWSILHRPSFQLVTGPKREYWLVRTVGGLAVAIGVTLGVTAATGRRTRESETLALASGLAFGAADLHAARVASRIYLADAALHAVLLAGWIRHRRRRRDGVVAKPPRGREQDGDFS
jgi:hypothetical protein